MIICANGRPYVVPAWHVLISYPFRDTISDISGIPFPAVSTAQHIKLLFGDHEFFDFVRGDLVLAITHRK